MAKWCETSSSQKGGNEEQGKNKEDEIVNSVAMKLLSMVKNNYQYLARTIKAEQQKEKKPEIPVAFKKYYKIWLSAIIFSVHQSAVLLRKILKEPEDYNDAKAMSEYWTRIETFCCGVQTIYKEASNGIHNPHDVLSNKAVAQLIVERHPETLKETLSFFLEIPNG